MKSTSGEVEALQALVEELISNKPNQGKLKRLMQESGIPYDQDPVNQMNQVLMALNRERPVKKPSDSETSL